MIGVDTNVLIYASDPRAGAKHAVALRLVGDRLLKGDALLPLNVVGEFIHVARRRLQLPVDEVRALVDAWRASATVEPFAPDDLDPALDAHRDHGLAIWDALIWAVCERAGATVLVTEDLQDGRTLGRVTFLSPFNPANARRLAIP